MTVHMGRPKKGEVREKLTTVVFKADVATLDDLATLENHAQDVPELGRRSVMIRRAIRELRERMEKESPCLAPITTS